MPGPDRARPRLPAAALSLALVLSAALPAAAQANPFLSAESGAAERPSAARGSSGPQPRAFLELQIEFRDKAAAFFSDFKRNPTAPTVAAVLAVAFLYGLLHATGPGHRKTVVFSLFVSRRAAFWEPAAAGFLSAGVHAASGIAVVLALGLLRGGTAPLAETDRAGADIEAGAFLALSALAALLAAGKVVRMVRSRTGTAEGEAADGRGSGALGLYGVVALSSVVPCPGAVLMLLFSLYLDLAPLGIAAVLAMSFGMGLVVSAAGYLAWFGRSGLFLRLKGRQRLIALASDLMELGSYLFLLAFALFMAWPVLA